MTKIEKILKLRKESNSLSKKITLYNESFSAKGLILEYKFIMIAFIGLFLANIYFFNDVIHLRESIYTLKETLLSGKEGIENLDKILNSRKVISEYNFQVMASLIDSNEAMRSLTTELRNKLIFFIRFNICANALLLAYFLINMKAKEVKISWEKLTSYSITKHIYIVAVGMGFVFYIFNKLSHIAFGYSSFYLDALNLTPDKYEFLRDLSGLGVVVFVLLMFSILMIFTMAGWLISLFFEEGKDIFMCKIPKTDKKSKGENKEEKESKSKIDKEIKTLLKDISNDEKSLLYIIDRKRKEYTESDNNLMEEILRKRKKEINKNKSQKEIALAELGLNEKNKVYILNE